MMFPRKLVVYEATHTQNQPQVKGMLLSAIDHVDVDVEERGTSMWVN